MLVTVDASHLPAIKHASRAVRVSDRQPLDGLYLTVRDDVATWVGLNLWRALGAQIPGVTPLRGIAGPAHKFDHLKVPSDVEGEKPYPSEVEDMKAILAEGGAIEVELDIPEDDQIIRMLDQLYRQSLGGGIDELTLPKRGAVEWKDEAGKPRDLWVRDVYGIMRGFGADLVDPYRGKLMRRFNDTTWGFREGDKFGWLAEREKIQPVEVEEKEIPPSPWAYREEG